MNYKNKTLLQLIEELIWFDKPNRLKEIFSKLLGITNDLQEQINNLPSGGGESEYKTYVALLNQSDTNAPVPTILENITIGTITWSRVSTGVYEATWSGGNLSVANCIIPVLLGQIPSATLSFNSGKVRITWTSGAPQDNFLNNYPLEIKFV